MKTATRLTSSVLMFGTVVSAACFLIALGLVLVGRPQSVGTVDPPSIIGAVLEPRPWGWATLGVLTVIVTPALGLLATAVEFRGGRSAWVALLVVGILGVSVAVALIR